MANSLMSLAGNDPQKKQQLMQALFQYSKDNPYNSDIANQVMAAALEYNSPTETDSTISNLITQKESENYLSGDDTALDRLNALNTGGVTGYKKATTPTYELNTGLDDATKEQIVANKLQNLYNNGVKTGNFNDYVSLKNSLKNDYEIVKDAEGKHSVYKWNKGGNIGSLFSPDYGQDVINRTNATPGTFNTGFNMLNPAVWQQIAKDYGIIQ